MPVHSARGPPLPYDCTLSSKKTIFHQLVCLLRVFHCSYELLLARSNPTLYIRDDSVLLAWNHHVPVHITCGLHARTPRTRSLKEIFVYQLMFILWV